MHVEFTGVIARWTTPDGSPASLAGSRAAQRHARALEASGFDRLAVSDPEGLPDNIGLAGFILRATRSLQVTIPHRAGLADPVAAAQALARLDRESGGRLSIRLSSGNEVTQSGGERPFDHEAEMARADEYLVLLKRLWTNDVPFDHEGPFYSLSQAFSADKPGVIDGIPVWFDGSSGTAVKVAARHADRFALSATADAETRRTVQSRVRAAASAVGRADRIVFSLDIRLQPEPPRRIVRRLLDHCGAGISEFVVSGLETAEDVEEFGRKVIRPVRRTLGWENVTAPRAFESLPAGRPAARL